MVKKKNKKLIILLVAVIAFLLSSFAIYFYAKDYYKATATAEEALAGSDTVEVSKKKLKDGIAKTTYYHFNAREEKKDKKGGIIFYPGAKVEEVAYAPLLLELAEEGYEVFLVRMPLNLAILGSNKADRIIEEYDQIENWIMMGHSLGGAMAASYAADNQKTIQGLVLLAAYSTKDISDSGISVLQIYGSNDEVLNRKSLDKYAKNLPEDAIVYEIEGGNHANFAFYGEQRGDGEATITRKEQLQILMDEWKLMETRGMK